jgi:hypothetical protein
MVPHFRDEMYGDVKMPVYNVQGRIVRRLNVRGHDVRGHNVRGRIVPVPTHSGMWPLLEYVTALGTLRYV